MLGPVASATGLGTGFLVSAPAVLRSAGFARRLPFLMPHIRPRAAAAAVILSGETGCAL
jgi:hypothetical protein